MSGWNWFLYTTGGVVVGSCLIIVGAELMLWVTEKWKRWRDARRNIDWQNPEGW